MADGWLGADEVTAEFGRYLRFERDLSPHTVRAYLSDVTALFEHLDGRLHGLDISTLREWLAEQHADGKARATLARRTACVRTFTAYCHRRGWLPDDPGLLLGSAKAPRPLPAVLDLEQAQATLEVPSDGEPKELRDQAILELLYATGVRVSELCALDVDDVDRDLDRREGRVAALPQDLVVTRIDRDDPVAVLLEESRNLVGGPVAIT